MSDTTPSDHPTSTDSEVGGRRAFLKRAAIGAVAVPVLASFSMNGMNIAGAQTPAVSGTTTTKASTTTSSTTTSSTTTTSTPLPT
jgi:hypothetical protein